MANTKTPGASVSLYVSVDDLDELPMLRVGSQFIEYSDDRLAAFRRSGLVSERQAKEIRQAVFQFQG